MFKIALVVAGLLLFCNSSQAESAHSSGQLNFRSLLPISAALEWDFLEDLLNVPASSEEKLTFSFSIAEVQPPTGFHGFVIAN